MPQPPVVHRPQPRDDALAALVDDLAADPHLVDEVVRAVRAAFPEATRRPSAEIRQAVAALLTAGFVAFTRDGEPDFTEACRFGAGRAALGVPVAALLSGVHAGRGRILEIAIERGRAAGIPAEVMMQALLRLDRYGILLERHVVEAYRAARRDLRRDHRDARIALLRTLLLGEHGDGPAPDPARFGVRADGRYHCLVADAADPAQIRHLERAFSRCGGAVAPVSGRLAGLVPRLPSPAPDTPALVVTTPAVALGRAPAAYALCLTALRAAGGDARAGTRRAGTHDVTALAGETALAAQPMLAGFLSESLLGGLDPGDEFHHELASTALTYLDHGQRLDRTAEALHLHPNTVRYRLRRLEELTGLGERLTVLETVRWWWALRSWPASSIH
ncbi:helix-turn-helix domain-containing protein [Actinoplanes sp. NPDC051346]|uniref:PucR family transcriptional regulator n=1 Tax=Actinoplanes sp. NPDC051346 TaxID=3155048 RepID=UPI0034299FC9